MKSRKKIAIALLIIILLTGFLVLWNTVHAAKQKEQMRQEMQNLAQ